MHDAIIIGLGAMGSATAYELAAKGVKVLGLEQFAPLHDQGSSHGKTRMFRKAYMEGDFYIPLLDRAYEKWKNLQKNRKAEVFNPCGVLYVGKETDGPIARTRKSGEAYDIKVEKVSKKEFQKRFPLFKPEDDHIALYEPEAGYVVPDAALSLYHKMAKAKGAELRFKEEVTEIRIEDKGIAVKTGEGTYKGRKLVLSTGAWTRWVLEDLGYHIPLEVWRMLLHWFKPKGKKSGFEPDAFPANLWCLPDGGILYGFPWTRAEEGVKYAFHNRQNMPSTPTGVDREVEEREVEEIRNPVLRHIPAIAENHLKSKTCFYTMTPDHHFVMGRLSAHQNVFVCSGFSGHGFKFMPVVGEVMRDLVLAGGTDFDISHFNPDRF